METQVLVPLKLIDHNPYQQPGVRDDAKVLEIVDSLKHNCNNGSKGLLQVPTARAVNGHYELAFGHHRFYAFENLSQGDPFFSEMPILVRELSDQEMFEAMAAENFKRRDIDIIEKARTIQDYMVKFDKSSVEAGEFFTMSPETVRGTVRYLNLPEDVQQKLATGEMTQTTARTLLSMQKIAPAQVISETALQFEKGKDRFGFEPTPDEVIEDVLEALTEVKEMWPSYRTGKPRGGDGDAWLLDMKNFPSKLLPSLTAQDIAIALGVQDEEHVLEEIDAAFAGWSAEEDWELIYESLKGRLADRPDLLEKIEHLVKPPACTACPFYTVVDGTHYCGMKTCFDRKTYAWNREKLRAASKDLGIVIYSKETDGEFRVLEETWSDNGKKHLELFRKRHKDLRLALAADIDRKKQQSGYGGVPSGSVVMLVGKTLKNLLESGTQERAQKRSKEHAAAVLADLLEEKRAALEWEVAGHVKTLFDGLNLAALNALWDSPQYSGWKVNRYTFKGGKKPSKDDTDSVQEEYLRQLFALNMIKTVGNYYRKTMAEYAAHLAETMKGWGVRLPKSVAKLAAQMDAEIATVSTETEA